MKKETVEEQVLQAVRGWQIESLYSYGVISKVEEKALVARMVDLFEHLEREEDHAS